MRGHHGEALVRLVEGFEDRVGAAGDERIGAPLAQQIDGAHDRGEPGRFLLAHRHVRTAQPQLEAGDGGGRVRDGAVEEQRGRAPWSVFEERIEEHLRRSAAGGPRAEHHAFSIVAVSGNVCARIVERQLGRGDGIHGRAIHAPHLHRRHPRRRIEAGDLGGDRRSAAGDVEAPHRRDGRATVEERVAKSVERRAERRNDAETRDAHRLTHAPYVTICCDERSSAPPRDAGDRRARCGVRVDRRVAVGASSMRRESKRTAR